MHAMIDKANAAAITGDRLTALHEASKIGHLRVASLLSNYPAYIEATNLDGWMPLDYAAFHVYLEVIRLVMDSDSNIETTIYMVSHSLLRLIADHSERNVTQLSNDHWVSIKALDEQM